MYYAKMTTPELISEHKRLVGKADMLQHEILVLDDRISAFVPSRGLGERHMLAQERRTLDNRLDRVNARLMQADEFLGDRACRDNDALDYLTSHYVAVGIISEDEAIYSNA